MPTYVFKCINKKCKEIFEIECKMSELDDLKGKVRCPKGHRKAELQLSRPNIIFAGHGWERDGYGITQTEMDHNIEEGCKADPTCPL